MYSIFSAVLVTALIQATAFHPTAWTDRASVRPMADTLPFDTTQVVVTSDDFAQLLTFLRATMHEWNKPEARRLMTAHQLQYRMELGDYGTGVVVPPPLEPGRSIPIPDYALIADSMPTVAQGLASAKLTGRRYLQLSRTLSIAWVTDQLDRSSHDGTPQVTETKTVIGKNVAFIRSHQAEFAKLVELGLDVITLRTSDAFGDLNP
jgi:hypothetical protein